MHLNINGYRVIDDPMLSDSPWPVPLEIEKETQRLCIESMQGKAAAKTRIEELIRQYPNLPTLRNYLMSWHIAHDMPEEVTRINNETLKLFPDYVFSIAHKVQELVPDGKVEEAGILLRGHLDIGDFYPGRKVFHISEFTIFNAALIHYLAASYRFDEVQGKIDLLEKTRINRSIIENLQKVKLGYMFERGAKWRAECQSTEVNAIECEEMTVLQRELSFTDIDTQLESLYYDLWDIDIALLKDSIENNKENLIVELNHILTIAVEGYEYLENEDDVIDPVLHALLILAYIDDEASFPLALQLLRQPRRCVDHWLGDWGDEVLNQYFRNYSVAKLQQIQDFMLESPGNTSSKNLLISQLPKFTVHTPEVRKTLLDTLKTIFAYFTANKDNKELFDTDVLAFTVGAAVDLRATELLDDIERLYAQGYVSLMVEGTFEDVKNSIITGDHIHTPTFCDNLFTHLDKLNDILERNKKFNKPVKTKTLISSKVSRNAPCPCGSGKKYKRCHGKNS